MATNDSVFSRLVRTMMSYFRIGNIRITDNSGTVETKNSDGSAYTDLRTKNIVYEGQTVGYRHETSSPITLTDDDCVLSCGTGGYTVNLPTAVGRAGKRFTIIHKTGSSSITLDGDGTETINGTTTYVVNPGLGNGTTIISDGSNWYTEIGYYFKSLTSSSVSVTATAPSTGGGVIDLYLPMAASNTNESVSVRGNAQQFYYSVSNSTPVRMDLRKTYGTIASPNSPVNGDSIAEIRFQSFTGLATVDLGIIRSVVTATSAATGRLDFLTRSGGASTLGFRLAGTSATFFGAVDGMTSLSVAGNATVDNVIPDTTATTTEGAIGYNSTTKMSDFYNSGMRLKMVGVIDYSHITDKTVTNTVTETTLLNSTVTLPANFWTVNKKIKITLVGDISALSTSSPDTFTFTVKQGATAVTTSNAYTVENVNARSFEVVSILTCRAVGVSGSIVGYGSYHQNAQTVANGGSPYYRWDNGSATINTTTSQTLDVTITMGNASTSNIVSAKQVIIEVL